MLGAAAGLVVRADDEAVLHSPVGIGRGDDVPGRDVEHPLQIGYRAPFCRGREVNQLCLGVILLVGLADDSDEALAEEPVGSQSVPVGAGRTA